MHSLRMLLQTVLGFLFTIGMSWILLAIVRFVLHFIRFSPFDVNGIEILLGSLLLLQIMGERRSSIWNLVK